jgi:hypothetical protein
MSVVEANCPACGAPVTFKVGSSIVVVCEYCNSAIARTDRALEDLGKVAELVQTGSPLDVGLSGANRGVAFQLTGRAQLGHEAGGVWDEWYAAFADGRWGWLAEAQGRFYLTFQIDLPEHSLVPPFQALELGQRIAAIPVSSPLVVAEKGTAKALGAKGEIPYKLIPNETYNYADLSGAGGIFATLDYSENPPLVYIGREVTLAELGISIATSPTPEREARRVAAAQLSCPQCAGPLELRAPDKTERVTCPNCGSLLDVSQGKLRFLKSLQPRNFTPTIPLGAVGDFGGVKLTVIGYVVRSVRIDGTDYYWEEFLLYNPEVGFRWLVQSDNHWNFVQTIPPGDVLDEGKIVQYGGKSFKLFQDATARVEYVIGEFYWKVELGESVRAMDYVNPPMMLSKEVSRIERQEGNKRKSLGSGEINWSLGTYMTVKQVKRAFGIDNLPSPIGVAPNQVYPHKNIYKYWAILFAITFILGLFFLISGANKRVFQQSYRLEPVKSADGTQVLFSEPFQLDGRRNIEVVTKASVDNSWVYIEGDFINEETGVIQPFSMPIEYYHGVDDGESWSEGGTTSTQYISALPAGKYTLRLEAQWERWSSPSSFEIDVVQGVPRFFNLLLALIGISIIPVMVVIRHFMFESARWSNSNVTQQAGSSSDD